MHMHSMLFHRKWALFLVAASVAGAWVAQAGSLSFDFEFDAGQVVYEPQGEYVKVFLDGCDMPVDETGAPWLPAQFVNVLLPAGATVQSVASEGEAELLRSDIVVYPAQPRYPKSQSPKPFAAPSARIYQSRTVWPSLPAESTGEHSIRGNDFVSIRLNPFFYVPAARELYFYPSLRLTVTYEEPSQTPVISSRNAGLFDEIVRATVINPDPSFAPLSTRQAPRDDAVDYLIITSATLSNAFQQLADYRNPRLSARVISVETIESSYEGVDTPAKIRQCISNHVATLGTAYVVLGGDDTIVPVRYCYVNAEGTVESQMPTDLYYSDLNGTWNANGNARYGETIDNVDMAWDVVVGRIPVRTATQAANYIAKLQACEADAKSYEKRILLGGMEAWDSYSGSARPTDSIQPYDGHAAFQDGSHPVVSDSEMWDRRLFRDGVLPYWTPAVVRIFCDTLTSWDSPAGSGNYEQTGSSVRERFNEGWYHMFFSGHGAATAWGLETGYFAVSEASSMTNKILVAYTDACLTGHFDKNLDVVDGQNCEPCLSEAFLRNPLGGALAFIGCSRYGWGTPDDAPASDTSDGGPSTVYGYKFYQRLHETDGRSLGQAFAMHKVDMIPQCRDDGCERWIQFGLNFQGDPAMLPWAATNAAPILTLSPGSTNKTMIVGHALSFRLSAYEPDGDTITLSASGVPDGAVFSPNPTTGSSPLTNSFEWTALSTGIYQMVFSAGDKDGTNSLGVQIRVVEPYTGGGLETFDEFEPSIAAYMSGEFAGQDSSVWTYAKCRGDQQIDGSTPTLGNNQSPQAFIRSGTIVGGCGSLSFKYRKPFSMSVNCDVYVNTTWVGTVTGGDGTTQIWHNAFVNIPGDVVFVFTNKQGSGQISLDDIAWTGYGMASNVLPFFMLPADTNVACAVSNLLPFVVTASTMPDAQAVTLWADGLPGWASFATTSALGTVSGVLSGTPTASGTNVVLFYVADPNGTNCLAVQMCVAGAPPPVYAEALAFQGFEGLGSDTWGYSLMPGSGIVQTTAERKMSGVYSMKMTGSAYADTDPSIVFSNIPIGCYRNVALWLAFSALGSDAHDDLYLDLSYDGGTSWTGEGSVKLVDGYAGMSIDFGATQSALPATVPSNPWHVELPPAATQVMVRVRMDEKLWANNVADHFFVDNIGLVGVPRTNNPAYTAWAATQGLDPNGLLGSEWEDFDGDGMCNGDEYIAGTQPTNPLVFFKVMGMQPGEPWEQLLSIQAVSGRIYCVESAANLLDASPWALLRTITNESNGSIFLADTNAAVNQLYRVFIRWP